MSRGFAPQRQQSRLAAAGIRAHDARSPFREVSRQVIRLVAQCLSWAAAGSTVTPVRFVRFDILKVY